MIGGDQFCSDHEAAMFNFFIKNYVNININYFL